MEHAYKPGLAAIASRSFTRDYWSNCLMSDCFVWLQILVMCIPVLLVCIVHLSGQFDGVGVFAGSIPLSSRGLFYRWRKVDLSDPSWRQFRNDMIRFSPVFLSVAVFHRLVGVIILC